MAAPKFSEWFAVGRDGEIGSQHLPAAFFQYRWRVDTEFMVPTSWFGVSGGVMKMIFALGIGEEFKSEDLLNMFCVTLRDPMTGGFIAFYTYYPALVSSSAALTIPTFAGADPYWIYAGLTSDWGIALGFIDGWFMSPIYQFRLESDASVDVQKWYPSSNINGGWFLEMRTAPATALRNSMLIDPVTGDKHLFRITAKALLCRRRMYDGSEDGKQTGLVLTYGGGSLHCTAGTAKIDYNDFAMAAAQDLLVPNAGTFYLFVTPDEKGDLELLYATAPLPIPALCMGKLVNGVLDGTLNGTLVAAPVDDYAVGRQEDGAIVVRYDSGSNQDAMVVSRDRGVTWEAA
jgi:hypothetical protein